MREKSYSHGRRAIVLRHQPGGRGVETSITTWQVLGYFKMVYVIVYVQLNESWPYLGHDDVIYSFYFCRSDILCTSNTGNSWPFEY